MTKISENVEDIEESQGVDEEVSLLPEREISEADMERAIQVNDDDETDATENSSTKTSETPAEGTSTEVEEQPSGDTATDSVVLIEDEDDHPAIPTGSKDFAIKDAPASLENHNCHQCNIEKICEFVYNESDSEKFICSFECIRKLKEENSDKFTIHLKRVPLVSIMETKKNCSRCKEEKACNFRFKHLTEFEYICTVDCGNDFITECENRYFIKTKVYLIDETTSTNDQICIQCNDKKNCKYILKQDSEDLYICQDDCLNLLLKEQPDKVRVKRRSVRVRDIPLAIPSTPVSQTEDSSESNKIVARTDEQAEFAIKDREDSFVRRCQHCSKVLGHPEKLLTWETLDFCSEYCLGPYQKKIGSNCAQCQKKVSATSLGKYCVRFGYNLKQFCCSKCLDEYKKGLKTCAYCQIDISAPGEGVLAPVGDKGKYKDFCTQTCMKKYEELCNPKKKPVIAMCAVCSLEKPVCVSVTIDNRIQKFCSNPCFSAFKFVNNILADQCRMCQMYFERNTANNYTIYQNNTRSIFCSQICMHIHIVTTRKIVPCNWCKVKKYNFDMISRVKGNQAFLMCSLNCLTHCEVSVNAMTQKSLKCDHCNTSTTTQYLLSMSDASVRNFCTYQCVLAFESQFDKSIQLLDGDTQQPTPISKPKRVHKGKIYRHTILNI